MVSPFVLFYKMKKSAGFLNDDNFLELYSSLYDEFWCDKGSIRTFYYPLFLMRRMVFQVFLNECPAAQLMLMLVALLWFWCIWGFIECLRISWYLSRRF